MRHTSMLLAFILSISGMFINGALGAEIKVLGIGGGEKLISLSGQITPEDGQKFLAVALSEDATLVSLASPGGSINAAIQIGDIVRSKGMTTIVDRGQDCASACGLIWLAGQRRLLTPTSRVGFHTAYVIRDGQRVGSPQGNALIGRYIARLDLPKQSFAFATAAGPQDLNWLDSSNKQHSGIDLELVETKGIRTLGVTATGALRAFVRGAGASQRTATILTAAAEEPLASVRRASQEVITWVPGDNYGGRLSLIMVAGCGPRKSVADGHYAMWVLAMTGSKASSKL